MSIETNSNFDRQEQLESQQEKAEQQRLVPQPGDTVMSKRLPGVKGELKSVIGIRENGEKVQLGEVESLDPISKAPIQFQERVDQLEKIEDSNA